MSKNTIAIIVLSITTVALFALNLHLFKRLARLEARPAPAPVALGPIHSPDGASDEPEPSPIVPSKQEEIRQPNPDAAPIPVQARKAPLVAAAQRTAVVPAATDSSRDPAVMSEDEKKTLDEEITRMRALFDSKMAEIEAGRKDAAPPSGSAARKAH